MDLPGSREAFVADYRLTACLNSLAFLSNHNQVKELFSEKGAITREIINFAKEQIDKVIQYNQHEFINNNLTVPILTESVWVERLSQFQSLMTKKDTFKCTKTEQIEECVNDIKKAFKSALSLRPQLRKDGNRNIWIVKPGNKCRGVGIVIFDSDKNVLDYIEKNRGKRHVVQKYMGE
jgi:tubulin monoglycylase TTLL3/8